MKLNRTAVTGALLGGIVVGLSETYFSVFVNPAYSDVFVFGLMAFFLLVRPGGIFRANISEKV